MLPHNPQIFENIRPDWLISHEGGRLELDFYIPSLDLAIEVQGQQHFEFVELFHQDKRGYEEQLKRDKIKKDLCRKAGIRLVEILQETDIDDLILEFSYPDVLSSDYLTTPPDDLTKDGKPRLTLQEIKQQKKEARKQLRFKKQVKKIELKTKHKQEKQEEYAMSEMRQKEFIANKMKIVGSIENIGKNRRAFNRKIRQLNNKMNNSLFIIFMNEVGIPESYFNNVLKTS